MLEKLTTAGQRVRYARLVAGFTTRKELSEKHGLSTNTLQGWEQGKAKLTHKGAVRLSKIFQQEGTTCTEQWLLTGVGELPYSVARNEIESSTNQFLGEYISQEEKLIQNEIINFKVLYPNSVIRKIEDDSFAPQYCLGDYVGGLRLTEPHDIEKYVDQLCIVEFRDHSVCTERLQLDASHTENTIKSVAPIVWHRKKLARLLPC